jgi:anti-anti-sigma factor
VLFTVEVSAAPDETVLTLHGELDISTQQRFAAALARIDESTARIVLDLSDLTYIDCGNIGLIHQARVLAALRGTHFEIRDTNAQLLRIFELTGFDVSNGEEIRPIVLPLPARAYDPSARW